MRDARRLPPTPRRLLAVAGLELRIALAGPLTWCLLGLALLASTALNVTTFTSPAGAGSELRPYVNSQHAMAWMFAMSGFLLYGFFSALVAGPSTIRDDEHRISELLRATGLRRLDYLGGKLLGALAALALALALHLVAALLLFELGPVAGDLARGPFRWGSYLLPALLFPLPVVWFFGAFAFVVGERTRQPIAVFAVPVVFFFAIVWLISWTPAGLALGVDRLLMIVDPTGLRWLLRTVLSVDRGVEFYNTSPLPLDAVFVLNRLFTLVLPLPALAWVARERRERPGRRAKAPAATSARAAGPARPLRALGMTRSPASWIRSALHVARSELRELRGQPGLYVFVPLLMLTVWDAAASARGPYDSAVILTAGRLAMETIGTITILACLVLLFYVGQSMAREPASGLAPLLYAAPVPTRAIVLGKILAHVAVAALLLGGCCAVAGVLLGRSRAPFEVWPLVLVWGLVLGPTLLLWISFVTATSAVVRSPPATYAVGLAALVLSFHHLRLDSMSWLTNWTLLGALRWSDMGIFPLNARPLLLNRLLALGVALVLTAVAVRWFPRVERDRPRPRRTRRSLLYVASFAALPAVLAGALAIEIHEGFQGGAAERRDREYRRLNFNAWHDFEPAHVRAVDLVVGLEPAARTARVEGTYVVANPSDAPMPRLPFTVGQDFEGVAWTVDGEPIMFDDRAGLHVLEPAIPLAAGGEARIGFSYRLVRPRGFTKNGGGVEQFILPSGTLLHTLRDSFLPVPGFSPDIGLEHDDEPAERPGPGDGGPVPFLTRIQVTAPAEHTVTATGRKTAETTQDGLTTVVWETRVPVRALNLMAGRWEERRRRDAAVYFHAAHGENVDAMLATLIAARDHYSRWFHPYPWDDLKLGEFPNLATNALGFATNIPFSEGIGFLAESDPTGQPAFLVIAHEVAHQWWGNLVAPASGPGTGHLVEGMAHYSALLLTEAVQGPEARAGFARRMERNYCERRRVDTERPLIDMVDDRRPADRAVVYEKGAWVMWMLQEHLGRERLLAGLQSFVRQFVDSSVPPTTRDLIESLRPFAPAPDAYQRFVDQWFHAVVLPKLEVSEVSVVPRGDRYRVTALVTNVGSGSPRVEVALRGAGQPQVEEHVSLRLVPGRPARVAFELSFEPERLVVDPHARVLQCDRHRAAAELKAFLPGG